jgi:hypothetical protein
MGRIVRFPTKEGALSNEFIIDTLNRLMDVCLWISPIFNDSLGQIQPPVEYRRDGMLAYADGTNWLPNGSGGKGFWRWNSATNLWVSVG